MVTDIFATADGWHVESVAFDVHGHEVEILRFDGDDNAMIVAIDNTVSQMPMSEIDNFILERI